MCEQCAVGKLKALIVKTEERASQKSTTCKTMMRRIITTVKFLVVVPCIS